jgi:nucleoid DNA-binding protein
MATKKISRKQSLRRTAFYDSVVEKVNSSLVNGTLVSQLKRKDAKIAVQAVVDTLIQNSITAKGCTLPGFGKVYFRYRKPRVAGQAISRFTGQPVHVKARKACWIPKFRLIGASKKALMDLAPTAK